MNFLKTTLALALASALPAFGQQPPDAGRVLQENRLPTLTVPQPGTSLSIPSRSAKEVAPGGATVILKGVQFSGNTCFSEAELQKVVGDVSGQSFDLAGLYGIAEKITQHYHANGFPFARAFLPGQNVTDGVIRLDIVEGRFGKVLAQGDANLSSGAQRFLASLEPGAVIESDPLERATLILNDQPGIKTMPILRPGQELGTGDLVVEVSRTPLIRGDVGLDNHGNRYTGETRLHANLQIDSLFLLGDQITIRSLYSEEDLWLGSIGYSVPLGASGLRANASYAHTSYQLGKDFTSLDAHGTAQVTSAGLSYPVIRSQQSNLTLAASWQHKKLNDQQDSSNTDNDKSSTSGVMSMSFDHRDGLGGGGITYGVLSWTAGHLKLDSELEATDRSSHTDTRGSFNKWNLDLARLQMLPANFSLLGRLSFQGADSNLDSSEDFSLGGPNGVHAYPVGEGIGDEGWLAQIELRYKLGDFSPYLFHDAGGVRINAKPGSITPSVTDNRRNVSGSGVGVRYAHEHWNADLSLAWRNHGGEPTSDTSDRRPRAWATMSYRF